MVRVLFTLLILFPTISFAEAKWEVSIGSTQMFVGGVKDKTFPLPTASSTLIVSRSLYEDFALWAIVNFPLSVNKRITNEGVVVEAQTPPVVMLGLSYTFFGHRIDEKKSIGLDAGFSLGRTIDLAGQYFPIGAIRFKYLKEDSSIYIGLTTSPYNMDGDMVYGVIYGLGHRF